MSSEPQSDASRAYMTWLSSTPSGTKFLTASVLLVSSIGLGFGANAVLLVPQEAVSELQVSRMVYASFCETGLFGIVTTLLWLNTYGKQIEADVGTKEYLVDLLLLVLGANVVYCALAYLFCSIGICVLLIKPVGGMFPTIISMVMKYPRTPEIRLFGMVAIPTRYFPAAIITLVAVFTNSVPLELIVPATIAYAQTKGFLKVENNVHCLSVVNKVEELIVRGIRRLNGSAGYSHLDEDTALAPEEDLESQSQETREAKRKAALQAALSRAERVGGQG